MAEINVLIRKTVDGEGEIIDPETVTVFIDDDPTNLTTDNVAVSFLAQKHMNETEVKIKHLGIEHVFTVGEFLKRLGLSE
jgi:hypothetical protein